MVGARDLRRVDRGTDETADRARSEVIQQARFVGLTQVLRIRSVRREGEAHTSGLGSNDRTWKMQPKYPPFHQRCLESVM